MKFNNRANECVTLEDGRVLWLSRSIAVTASILLVCKNTPYILVNQRGPGVPDGVGLWNLPCGYLDYDETTSDAAQREVWEECGLDVRPFLKTGVLDYFTYPWDVGSKPIGDKQNVTIHHGLAGVTASLPLLTNQYAECDEVSAIKWLPLAEVDSLAFAFNHRLRIERYVRRVVSDKPSFASPWLDVVPRVTDDHL